MDVGTLIKGLIVLLIVAAFIALACYIVTRILIRFFPGAAEWAWIVWCIGGLVWLLALISVFHLNMQLW